jgi:hypothetical protein
MPYLRTWVIIFCPLFIQSWLTIVIFVDVFHKRCSIQVIHSFFVHFLPKYILLMRSVICWCTPSVALAIEYKWSLLDQFHHMLVNGGQLWWPPFICTMNAFILKHLNKTLFFFYTLSSSFLPPWKTILVSSFDCSALLFNYIIFHQIHFEPNIF